MDSTSMGPASMMILLLLVVSQGQCQEANPVRPVVQERRHPILKVQHLGRWILESPEFPKHVGRPGDIMLVPLMPFLSKDGNHGNSISSAIMHGNIISSDSLYGNSISSNGIYGNRINSVSSRFKEDSLLQRSMMQIQEFISALRSRRI